MTIEILVVRDPDSSNEIRVFIDGQLVTDEASSECRVIDIDAGAGYLIDDWDDNARGTIQHLLVDGASDEFVREVEQTYADPPGSKYIDGFTEPADRYPYRCMGCGKVGTEDDMLELGGECPDEDCDGIITFHRKPDNYPNYPGEDMP